MKNSWFSKMQKLGRATGYGMALCVRIARSSAESKSSRRMKLVEGEPRPLANGSRLTVVPMSNKRSGKIIHYSVVSVAR